MSYVDAVLNHRFGADRLETFGVVEVDNDDRTKEITDKYDIKVRRVFFFSGTSADLNQGWTGFDFPGRGNKVSTFFLPHRCAYIHARIKYSSLKYTFNHFTGVDYNDETQKTSIYKIHGDGKDWAQAVDKENRNYDYLSGYFLLCLCLRAF